MPETSSRQEVALPESLRLQLDAFRRRLWREKCVEALAAAALGLLLSFLLVYGLDRLTATPGWLRLVILIGGSSLAAVFAPYWLHRWVWQQRRHSCLARLIARRTPGLGDRLLGVIELQQQQDRAESFSPRLREAAMAAVAAEVDRTPLELALPPSQARRWSLAALGLAVFAVAAFLIAPAAGWNALQRWLMPLSATERFTFTRLAQPPSQMAVPYGEAFEVELRLAADSSTRPDTASARYASQAAIQVRRSDNSYRWLFPGQQSPGVIRAVIGDLQHDIEVVPTPRPAVQAVRARVLPPAYLGMTETTQDVASGVLQAVDGATVRIELQMDRPLTAAVYGPAERGTAADAEGQAESAPPTLQGDLEIVGSKATTPSLALGSVSFELPFTWRDTLGLSGEKGFRLRVESVKDSAPSCYLQGTERQKAILPEETIDLEVMAEDDFGLTATGLEWTGAPTRSGAGKTANGEMVLDAGGPGTTRTLKRAAFSPAALGIGPQKLTLRAFTADALPGRARSYSEPITLYVLDRDEHAQLLKSQFDRQISELEDLTRRETSLLDENQRLERLEGSQLQQDEARKRLENQQQEERDTQSRLEELTRRMEQLMLDATRNGEIEPQTLKSLAETLKSMQELSQQDVPKLRQPLERAGEPSNTPEQAAKEMDDATAQQEQAVEKMRRTVERANEANRQFEAGTFVNRLKKAAKEELGIVQSLKAGFSRLLGLDPRTVDPADLRGLEEQARQQSDTASDVRWLQEDLGHYHARTQQPAFKEILDAMKAAQIDLAMEDIRTKLQRNHSFVAAEEAKRWGEQLQAWANHLEGGKSQGGQGQGGGDSAPDPENEDFEFMLRVMKMVQQQQDLRGRTRALDQLRRSEVAPKSADSSESPQSSDRVNPPDNVSPPEATDPLLPENDPLLPDSP